MAFDVETVAEAATTTLIGAMATDAWGQVRRRLGALIGRGDREREAEVMTELDRAGESADPRGPLEQLLREYLAEAPDAVPELEALLADVRGRPRQEPDPRVVQHGSAGDGGTIIQIGGSASGVSVHRPDREPGGSDR